MTSDSAQPQALKGPLIGLAVALVFITGGSLYAGHVDGPPGDHPKVHCKAGDNVRYAACFR